MCAACSLVCAQALFFDLPEPAEAKAAAEAAKKEKGSRREKEARRKQMATRELESRFARWYREADTLCAWLCL